jgi:hypothetical protein
MLSSAARKSFKAQDRMLEMNYAREIPGAVTLMATKQGVTHLQAIGKALLACRGQELGE